MPWQERIIIDPDILVGKPVVKGTRLSVDFIIDLLAQGWSEKDILENYPGLTHEDIQACLGYASAALPQRRFIRFRFDVCDFSQTKTSPRKPLRHSEERDMT